MLTDGKETCRLHASVDMTFIWLQKIFKVVSLRADTSGSTLAKLSVRTAEGTASTLATICKNNWCPNSKLASSKHK